MWGKGKKGNVINNGMNNQIVWKSGPLRTGSFSYLKYDEVSQWNLKSLRLKGGEGGIRDRKKGGKS